MHISASQEWRLLLLRLHPMTYRALANAAVVSIVAFAASSVPAWGQGKTTRIEFPRGSYCSTYAGQLSGDRQFLLELARGQTLVTRNLGPSYRIAVSGPTGMLSGWQAAPIK